jgi:hypothetical protein
MPTVLRSGPFRFFFYAGDRDEPVHVHVERDEMIAKFWLDPVRLQSSGGFSRTDLGRIQRIIIEYHSLLMEWLGMSTSMVEIEVPNAENLVISDDTITVDLSDGRTISVPLNWFPRLFHGSSEERANWRFVGKEQGMHWKDLDEDISVESLLTGRPSQEGQSSFKKWLGSRATRTG